MQEHPTHTEWVVGVGGQGEIVAPLLESVFFYIYFFSCDGDNITYRCSPHVILHQYLSSQVLSFVWNPQRVRGCVIENIWSGE